MRALRTLFTRSRSPQAVSFMFGGFFVPRHLVPRHWAWLYYGSFFTYGFSASMVNEFEGRPASASASASVPPGQVRRDAAQLPDRPRPGLRTRTPLAPSLPAPAHAHRACGPGFFGYLAMPACLRPAPLALFGLDHGTDTGNKWFDFGILILWWLFFRGLTLLALGTLHKGRR
eukprot:tig00020904_g15162.t1